MRYPQRVLLALALLLFAEASQARTAPLVDPAPLNIPAGFDQAAVVAAIKKALTKRHWEISAERPGYLEAILRPDDHMAHVRITWNEREVHFAYINSENLNYAVDDGRVVIHPEYLVWVNYVVFDVKNRFALGPSSESAPDSVARTKDDPIISVPTWNSSIDSIVQAGVPNGFEYRKKPFHNARSVTVKPGSYAVRIMCNVPPFLLSFDAEIIVEPGYEYTLECLGTVARATHLKTTREPIPERARGPAEEMHSAP
jgi:hypothetical protein